MTAEIMVRVTPVAKVCGWPEKPEVAARGDKARPHVACSLADALTRRWHTDALTYAYEATDDEHGRHRLATPGAIGKTPIRMVVSFVDVDDPVAHEAKPKIPARDEWRAVERAKVARLLVDHPGIVVYETRGGYRIVGLLDTPHVIATPADGERWRVVYGRRLAYLSRLYGIVGDWACHDWPRAYRLPRVRREGVDVDLPIYGNPHAVGTWPDHRDDELAADIAEVERLAAEVDKRWAGYLPRLRPTTLTAPAARRGRARSVAVDRDREPPNIGKIAPTARAVGAAIAAVTSHRHGVLQAVIGALYARGWGRAEVRAWADELARVPGVLSNAEDTTEVARLADDDSDRPRRGWTSLRNETPAVAEELARALAEIERRRDEGLPHPAEATLREDYPDTYVSLPGEEKTPAARAQRRLAARNAPREVSADEASKRIGAAVAEARAQRRCRVIDATTGTGKTVEVCREAAEASRRGECTALLAPSHAVAQQMLAHLRAAGAVGVVYVGGLLALRDGEGKPVCHHAEAVAALADAGQDPGAVLCEGRHYGRSASDAKQGKLHLPMVEQPRRDAPCEHLATCEAYAQRREQYAALASATIVVTVHQLAGVVAEWVATRDNALVVIDEAPPLIDTACATVADLRAAAGAIEQKVSAVVRREHWRAPKLRALAEGIVRHTRRSAEGATPTVRDLLLDGLAVTELEHDREKTVDGWTDASRRHVDEEGNARGGERPRAAPRPSRKTAEGLRSNVSAQASALAAIRLAGVVGGALAAGDKGVVVRVGVRDHGDLAGAPEIRLATVAPSLRALLTSPRIGRVLLDATVDTRLLGAALGEKVDVVRVAVRDGARVERTFVPWAHGTRADCLLDGAPVWTEIAGPLCEGLALAAEGLVAGQTIAMFSWRALVDVLRDRAALPQEVRGQLDELHARGIALTTGYYGNTRGRDDWRQADALLAVGTPWPDVAQAAQVAGAVGLDEHAADVARHIAEAELEQVCGRLRAPRRSSRGRIVVVATTAPLRADRRWKVRGLVVGRPVACDHAALAARADEIGGKAAAREAGVDPATVRRARLRRFKASPHGPLYQGADPVAAQMGGGGTRDRDTSPSFAPPHRPPPIAVLDPPDLPPVATARCGGCAQAPPRASPRVASG